MKPHPEDREVYLPYGNREVKVITPARNLLAVVSPNPIAPCPDPLREIKRALWHPIGATSLTQAVSGARSVIIAADDLTRRTPVHLIIPLLLDELNTAGINDGQIKVLIALGTHRPMSQTEIQERFGNQVLGRVEVLNNSWQDPVNMIDLGVTSNGTSIQISRPAVEADFVIGLGSILPHHIPGFSAGAKIVQPGLSGEATTGATHYLSTRANRSYLGVVENPVRAEMETIAERIGLKAILNTVLDQGGRLVRAFFGHPQAAHRAGAALAREVYGVPLPGKADIVVASSHPCDLEFWQAHKSLYPADMALRAGGTIILVTPCPEGVSVTHQDMLDYTAQDADTITGAIENGAIRDLVSGALALAWAKIRRRAAISLVSEGISDQEARALAFTPFPSLDQALEAALHRHGPEAKITVMTHAPETLPLFPRRA